MGVEGLEVSVGGCVEAVHVCGMAEGCYEEK